MSTQVELTERCLQILAIPEGRKCLILDIGCGSGLSGSVISEHGHTWIGMDISESMLKIAKENEVEGDLINIDTFYSSYEYEVIKTLTVKNDYELKKVGAGLSRALVLYTDNSVGAGISNEYYVCVAVMKTGTKVNA